MRTLALVLMVGLFGCAQEKPMTQGEMTVAAADSGAVVFDTTNAVMVDPLRTRVKLFVTEAGFVPARVEVPAGKPVTLLVTRLTDKTCANELVMAEQGINEKLPLNRTVEITFTPKKAGELNYACGMDMIKGVVAVR